MRFLGAATHSKPVKPHTVTADHTPDRGTCSPRPIIEREPAPGFNNFCMARNRDESISAAEVRHRPEPLPIGKRGISIIRLDQANQQILRSARSQSSSLMPVLPERSLVPRRLTASILRTGVYELMKRKNRGRREPLAG